jgi:hypothetical protein
MSNINNILRRVKSKKIAPVEEKRAQQQAPKQLAVKGTKAAAARLTIDPLRKTHYLIQFSEVPVKMVKKRKAQPSAASSSELRFATAPVSSTDAKFIAMLDARDRREQSKVNLLLELHYMFNDTHIDMGGHDEEGGEYTSDMTNMHKVYGHPDFGKKYKAA